VVLLDIGDFDENEYPKSCNFIKADIRDAQLIKKVSKKTDVIIHAAAALPLWKKEEIFDINVNGTRSVLDAAYQNDIERFIFISSTAVYGVPKKHPIYEDDPLIGVGPYGQSKIDAEKLCAEYRKKGMVISILRPKTFLGTHRLGVFEILFDWIKDGKRIPIIGSGKNKYQLLDVDDLVEAIYRLIIEKDEKKVNTVFNIGAKRYQTVKKDLQDLFDYAHSGSKILPTPGLMVKTALWIFEMLRISPLYHWVYDTADKDSYVSIKKLTHAVNWEPEYSNSQALIKSYKWYSDHYKEIKSRPAGVTHMVGWKQGVLGFFKKFL
jgi:nucleoside-diphosphate-sugar epimerase